MPPQDRVDRLIPNRRKASHLDAWRAYVKSRPVFVGVGNPEKGDDGVGPAFIMRLQRRAPGRWRTVNAGVAPENCTGTIARLNPTSLILVDAADFGGRAGQVRVMPVSDTIGPGGLSSHALSISLLAQYLRWRCGEIPILLLGIQPATRWRGVGLSPLVSRTVDRLVDELERGSHA